MRLVNCDELRPHHVITSAEFEALVFEALVVYEHHPYEVKETFIEIIDRDVRNASSVTQSTAEAHASTGICTVGETP